MNRAKQGIVVALALTTFACGQTPAKMGRHYVSDPNAYQKPGAATRLDYAELILDDVAHQGVVEFTVYTTATVDALTVNLHGVGVDVLGVANYQYAATDMGQALSYRIPVIATETGTAKLVVTTVTSHGSLSRSRAQSISVYVGEPDQAAASKAGELVSAPDGRQESIITLSDGER